MANISLSDSDDIVYGTIFNDIISGGGGHDKIFGDWGYDQLFGGKGDDTLDGSLGNDLLMGQEGDDFLITSDSAEMRGGTGDDTYRIIAGDVFKPKLIEKAGEGVDTVQLSIWRGKSFTLGEHFENIRIQDYRWVDAPGPDYYVATKLTGNGANNVITGGGFGDALHGMGGHDTLRGGGGVDDLFGGAGDDRLEGGVGADRLFGGSGVDFLDGGGDADHMEGGTDNDTYLVENKGDKVIEHAGQGIDTVQTTLSTYTLAANVENLKNIGSAALFVGYGNALGNGMTGSVNSDRMFGGDGADKIYLGDGKDFAWGQGDADALYGQKGDDFLSGGLGRDYVDGGDGKDDLRGDGGDDVLSGGTGEDQLFGGTGYDWLWGGAGADTFTYLGVSDFKIDGLVSDRASEAIWDFGAGDRIDLSAIDANATLVGNQAFTFFGGAAPAQKTAGALWTVDAGADLMVLGDVNGDGWQDFGVKIVGLQSMTSADFIL